MNDRFLAWAEQVCNLRQHAETGAVPLLRYLSQGEPRAVEPSLLREAFRAAVLRRVTRTASVSLAGQHYTVDAALVGRRVELGFDPDDLTRLDVYWEGRPCGSGVPYVTGRHVQRQVPVLPTSPPAAPSTGVDYLGLVLAAHQAATLGEIAFRDLPAAPPEPAGPEVAGVVRVVWESLDYVCAERLTPALLATAQQLAQWEEVVLTGAVEAGLRSISRATVQRFLI